MNYGAQGPYQMQSGQYAPQFGGYSQNYVNPYAQQPRNYGIYGRQIRSVTEIVPDDVPMNGLPAYFPLADESKIYVKRWDTNGRIVEDVYIRQETPAPVTAAQEQPDTKPDVLSSIDKRLSAMEGRFEKLEKMLSE